MGLYDRLTDMGKAERSSMPEEIGLMDDDAQWIAHRFEHILGPQAAQTVLEQKSEQ